MFRVESGRVLAVNTITSGETILTRPWTEHVNFVAATQDMARQYARGCDDAPHIEPSLPDAVAPLMAHGTLISHAFAHLRSPGFLQLTCLLIEHHSTIAAQWVKDASLVRRKCAGVPDMDPKRHAVAIKWLRSQKVPVMQLTFWAVRQNFTALYEMIVGNSMTCELPLSGTATGLSFCPMLAQFNHSCMPNAYLQHLPAGYTLVATEDIAPGQEICFAYHQHAVGLDTLDVMEEYLQNRFGFKCACDLHTGKQSPFVKGTTAPRSVAAVAYRHKTLKPLLQALDTAVDKENWEAVRQLGRHLWLKYASTIRAEPSLGYAIASRYVTCISSTSPDPYGIRWTTLLEQVCEQYCANPFYTLRAHFWSLLETARRGMVTTLNPQTQEVEHVHVGCSGEPLKFLFGRWHTLRKYLVGKVDELIFCESHFFDGLFDLLHTLQPDLDKVTVPEPGVKNVTTCLRARELTQVKPMATAFVTPEQVAEMILKNKTTKKRKPRKKKEKLFIPMQIDCDDLEEMFQSPWGTWEQDCFIPRQFEVY